MTAAAWCSNSAFAGTAFNDDPQRLLGSGKEPLDRAAVSAIRSSNPFDHLPPAFSGPEIRLRFIFLYNLPLEAANDADGTASGFSLLPDPRDCSMKIVRQQVAGSPLPPVVVLVIPIMRGWHILFR